MKAGTFTIKHWLQLLALGASQHYYTDAHCLALESHLAGRDTFEGVRLEFGSRLAIIKAETCWAFAK